MRDAVAAQAGPRRACMAGTWPTLKWVTRVEARRLGYPELFDTAADAPEGENRFVAAAVYADLVFRGLRDAFAHVVNFADCYAWTKLSALVDDNVEGDELQRELTALGSGLGFGFRGLGFRVANPPVSNHNALAMSANLIFKALGMSANSIC